MPSYLVALGTRSGPARYCKVFKTILVSGDDILIHRGPIGRPPRKTKTIRSTRLGIIAGDRCSLPTTRREYLPLQFCFRASNTRASYLPNWGSYSVGIDSSCGRLGSVPALNCHFARLDVGLARATTTSTRRKADRRDLREPLTDSGGVFVFCRSIGENGLFIYPTTNIVAGPSIHSPFSRRALPLQFQLTSGKSKA